MILRYLHSFGKDYKRLPKQIQQQVDKALALLERNPHHPSLHTKRIKGTRDVWEARVTLAYRMTFHWESDCITLRRVGTHAVLQRQAK